MTKDNEFNLNMAYWQAVARDDAPETRRLLDAGADVNFINPERGLGALHIAAFKNAKAALRAVAAQPECDFLLLSGKGNLAARYAVAAKNKPVGRYLLLKAFRQMDADPAYHLYIPS